MVKAIVFNIITFSCLGMIGFLNFEPPQNIPKFLSMETEWEQVSKSEIAFHFKNPDTAITHKMFLLSNEKDQPLLFYSDIKTPICIDNVCKPLYVEVYWNLIGDYVGFGVHENQPLTKFDHEIFEELDHLKLHELLLNNHSILDRKKLSDLHNEGVGVNEQIKFKGVEVDAVSGATKKEIKESVVEGALYSCYTLWHLVHGKAAPEIRDFAPSIWSDSLAHYFLHSRYESYQLFALKKISAAGFKKNIPAIIQIFKNGKPLNRSYLIKKMPETLWKEQLVATEFYEAFSEIDMNSKTLLLQKMLYSGSIAVDLLSTQTTAMSKNQLKFFLNYLSENEEYRTESLFKTLENVSKSNEYSFAYLVKEFLEDNF